MGIDVSDEQVLDDVINEALDAAMSVGNSRENSLVITKLEEARSWNTLDIQRKENS
jgi:hypothetical protein